MSIFRRNFLPAQSQPWARQVEDRVRFFEGGLRSLDVNNRSKDEQFSAALKRLDAATINAQTSADQAQAAIDGLGALDEPTSTFKINAANITVGNLSGDRISGGEIIGTRLKTAPTGRRVELQQTNTSYFDENNNFAGQINGFTSVGGNPTLDVASADASASVRVFNGGVTLRGAGQSFVSVNDNGFFVSRFNGAPINLITDGNIQANGALTATGAMSSGSISTGGISCSSISSSGAVSGTTVSSSNFSGTVNTSIAANSTASFAGNVFINLSGNMFRSTATSSREAKENVEEYSFDTNAFIAVNPVTFNYKLDAVSDPEEAQIKQLGFILEDFEEAGAGEFLTIPTNEMDKHKGLRYDKLYMMLHKVVQEQQSTIKDLNTRIEALESR